MANTQKRGDPIDRLLPLFIDPDEPYQNEYQKMRRRRKKIPEELEEEADKLVKRLGDALKIY